MFKSNYTILEGAICLTRRTKYPSGFCRYLTILYAANWFIGSTLFTEYSFNYV